MRLHADAREVLASWVAPDEEQEELRRSYLAHLDLHPDAMQRDCLAGHLTASTAIVDVSGANTVLTLHQKIRLWLQTGGHCEAVDTSLADAALREATEESGIADLHLLPQPVRLDRHRVPCGGGTWHLDVQYAAIAPDGAPLTRVEAESAGLAWFPIDAVPEPTDGACRALVRAAAEAVRVHARR